MGGKARHDLSLGISGLGPVGVMGGAEESWLDSGPVEGLRLGGLPETSHLCHPDCNLEAPSASRAARGLKAPPPSLAP